MLLDDEAPRPTWAVPEAAWFLALSGGFAATWAGALTGLAGVGTVFAAVFATVYQAILHRRRAHGAAGMVAGAAMLGVLVGAIGLVVEQGHDLAQGLFPFADLYLRESIAPLCWVDRAEIAPGLVGAASWVRTAAAGGLAAVLLALARPTRGLAPLLGAACAAGMLGIAAPAAAAGGAPAETHVLLALHSVPPWALLQLLGVVLLQSVLASEERVLPLDELPAGRRRLVLIGASALGVGLLVQPLLAGPWGAWVPTP